MTIEVDDDRAPSGSAAAPAAVDAWPAFEVFFRSEYPRIVVLIVAMTGSRPVAEEIVQESMLRAYSRWARVSRYDRPGAWVRRVALNLAGTHRARRRSEQGALDRLRRQRPPIGATIVDSEFWVLVRTLPRRQAAAVTLYYLEDRSVAEVAAILGCAEGTAKAHLHKGRATLARLLDDQEDRP